MQAHVLDIYDRARAASRFRNWHQEQPIVNGWISHMRGQGDTALGVLGSFLFHHWNEELQRHPAYSQQYDQQQWQQPMLTREEGSTFRSAMGPIEYILDLHAIWHRRISESITAVLNLGSSLQIPTGDSRPPILLGSGESRAGPRQTHNSNNRSVEPPHPQHRLSAGPQQTHHRFSSGHPNRQDSHDAGPSNSHSSYMTAPANRRRVEQNQLMRSYYSLPPSHMGPHPSPAALSCQGCGRSHHSALDCNMRQHPNWNQQWAHVDFRRSLIGLALQREAGGPSTSTYLP
jgi:hypothetical protein